MLSLDEQNAWRERYRQTNPGWRPATEIYADRVRAMLPPDGRFLDLGCGRGGLVEQLDHPLRWMAGVDPDESSLQGHRLDLPRAAGRSGALPFAAARFDVVAASWVLEHLQRPSDDLREIRRVLRPGGAFVFITPNADHPLVGLNRVVGRAGRLQTAVVDRLYGRPPADTFPAYYRANRAADLHRLAGAAGLRLVELQTIADPTYLAFHPLLFRLAGRLERLTPPSWRIHLVGVMTG